MLRFSVALHLARNEFAHLLVGCLDVEQNVPLAPNGLGLESALARAGSGSIENKSEFSKRAARIGHGIHGTSTKLSKLAQLAKRTSMFDDPAQDIAELTTVSHIVTCMSLVACWIG
jgi:syntaxin 5